MATITQVKLKQGTTPMLTAIVENEALQRATVYLAIRTRHGTIIKSNYKNSGDMYLEPVFEGTEQVGTMINVLFSQEETMLLAPGGARVEAGWILEDGTTDRSNVGLIDISSSLIKEVMRYGEYTT